MSETSAGAVWTGEVRFNEDWLFQPIEWQRPRRIFVCAHGDLFHTEVSDQVLDRVFAVMALARRHTFQVLTKRANLMRAYLASSSRRESVIFECGILLGEAMKRGDKARARQLLDAWNAQPFEWPLPNVWVGVSAEDQTAADARIPDLLATPAAMRFVSIEPMLGPVDLREGLGLMACPGDVDWVIAGGESGPHARPAHPAWFRSLRDQCAAAGVPFHFKQWGEWAPRGPAEMGYPLVESVPRVRLTDVGENGQRLGARGSNDTWMQRSGKRFNGRRLDGVEHDGSPS